MSNAATNSNQDEPSLDARRWVTAIQHLVSLCPAASLGGELPSPDTGRPVLIAWVRMTGSSAMDGDFLGALREEIAAAGARGEDIWGWWKTLAGWISLVQQYSLPMEAPELEIATYREAERQARNAELALLACLGACAAATTERHLAERGAPYPAQDIPEIAWPLPRSAAAWMCGLQGETRFAASDVLRLSLHHLFLGMADLSGMDLRDADLSGANLHGADLIGANLTGTNMSEADLYQANLNGINLSESTLARASLSDATLTEANLSGVDLSGVSLSNANLSRACLSRTNLSDADVSGANLSGADLSDVCTSNADLSQANLTGALLTGADLTFANLTGALLRDTDLAYADLTGADLRGADLHGAELAFTNLSCADLSTALGLTPKQFNESITNDETKFP